MYKNMGNEDELLYTFGVFLLEMNLDYFLFYSDANEWHFFLNIVIFTFSWCSGSSLHWDGLPILHNAGYTGEAHFMLEVLARNLLFENFQQTKGNVLKVDGDEKWGGQDEHSNSASVRHCGDRGLF